MKNVSLKFGNNKVILDNFSYEFSKGEKLGLVGTNGVGKVRPNFVTDGHHITLF
jgi:ATP-binding cassette subfamily F protein uup